MKTRNIILTFALSVSALCMQSCLKENNNPFGDKTASQRMQEYLDNAREVLYSAPNGWAMEYFTGYGGYNFAVKFIDTDYKGEPVDSVVAVTEQNPGNFVGSYFRLANDNGPVLSFDTYNDVLHFFATPDFNNYQGLGGDFEFIILSATPDEVILKGKRSGLISKLIPLEDNETMQQYALKSRGYADRFLLVEGSGNINDEPVKVNIDLTTRAISFVSKTEEGEWDELNAQNTYYLPTAQGIRFESTIVVNDLDFSMMVLNESRRTLSDEDGNFTIKFKPLPTDYTKFEDYIGEYTLQFSNGSVISTCDAKIEIEDEMGRIAKLSGFSNDYEGVYLWYNASTGRLQIKSQYVGVFEETNAIVAYVSDGSSIGGSSVIDCYADSPTTFSFAAPADQKMKANCLILFKEIVDEDGEEDIELFTDWTPARFYPRKLTRK